MGDKCEWYLDEEDWNAWNTSCQNFFMLSEGTPIENKFVYCPYCGKVIVETTKENQ